MSTNQKHRKVLLKVILLGNFTVGKTSLSDRIRYGEYPPQYRHTFGCDFITHEIEIEHVIDNMPITHALTLQIWDTYSQERFGALGVAYYRMADCAIIMYDVTNRESFKNVKLWMDELLLCHSSPGDKKTEQKISIAIVGNKIDLEDKRQVSKQELYDFCESYWRKDDYYQIDKTEYQNKCHLLCHGFIREYDMGYIPLDIYQLCFKFNFEYGINSIIHPFEISVQKGHGINEMIEKMVRTLLDISHYHNQSVYSTPVIDLDTYVSNKPNDTNYTTMLGLAVVSCALLYKYFG